MQAPETLPIVEKLDVEESAHAIYKCLSNFPYSFFLDSALRSEKLGQYSFIGIEPFLIFKSKKDRILLDWVSKKEKLKGNPFLVLKELFKRFSIDKNTRFPFPFVGGGVGYLSYDLKGFNERLPDRSIDDVKIPDAIICFYDSILAFDHSGGNAYIVSSGFPERGKRNFRRQKTRLENLKNTIRRQLSNCELRTANCVETANTRTKAAPLESNFTKESYIKTIERAKEYIKQGDIYQVNLSQRFKVDLDIEPFRLYEILRAINPAPFASFLNFGEIKVISASPERFLKKEGRRIETRPIKGTRPRGKTPYEDKCLKKELIRSVKDRAENLMIIDLERNDLGRICEYGSVRVKEFMTCEEYATVFHLVSTVEGKLRDGVDAADCLINCFPGGSITGAPKIRSMEIIEELEPVKRSVYTGAIGYISFNGNMDTSIAIRAFISKGKSAYFQVGGGIVYDSDPRKEYEETLDKAKALIDAACYGGTL